MRWFLGQCGDLKESSHCDLSCLYNCRSASIFDSRFTIWLSVRAAKHKSRNVVSSLSSPLPPLVSSLESSTGQLPVVEAIAGGDALFKRSNESSSCWCRYFQAASKEAIFVLHSCTVLFAFDSLLACSLATFHIFLLRRFADADLLPPADDCTRERFVWPFSRGQSFLICLMCPSTDCFRFAAAFFS